MPARSRKRARVQVEAAARARDRAGLHAYSAIVDRAIFGISSCPPVLAASDR